MAGIFLFSAACSSDSEEEVLNNSMHKDAFITNYTNTRVSIQKEFNNFINKLKNVVDIPTSSNLTPSQLINSLNEKELNAMNEYLKSTIIVRKTSTKTNTNSLSLEELSFLLDKMENYYAIGGHNIDFIYNTFKDSNSIISKTAICSAAYFDFFIDDISNVNPLSRRISCEDQFFLDTGLTVAEAGIGLGTDDIIEITEAFIEFSTAYAEYQECKKLERKGAHF